MRNFIGKSYHQLDHERAFNSSFFPMSFIYIQLFERRLANYLLSKELLCIFLRNIQCSSVYFQEQIQQFFLMGGGGGEGRGSTSHLRKKTQEIPLIAMQIMKT